MSDKARPFHVIDGLAPEDTPQERLHNANPGDLVSCRRCTGIAVVEVKLGMRRRKGKLVGGQKTTVCARCLANGDYVVLT